MPRTILPSKQWGTDFAQDSYFFATVETVEYPGRMAHDLGLQECVPRNLYGQNALHSCNRCYRSCKNVEI